MYKMASFLERLSASIIDGLILLSTFLLVYILFKSRAVELNILASFVSLLYNVLFIWKKGATPGKMLMNIEVVSTSFQTLGLWQAILRESLGKTISGLFFNLGYFWVLFDRKKQALHDKIAHTYVAKLDNTGRLIPVANEEPVTKKQKITFVVLYLILGTPFVAATVFLFCYIFFFRPFQVTGDAMSPAYKNKEYVMTSIIGYRSKEPQRGDVIVFHSPTSPEKDLIKRVIGLPGETVIIQENKVYIDNNELDEGAYLQSNVTTFGGSFSKEGEPITIPENSYFVMGDNRPFSADSREFGFVPKKEIIGKISFCYYNCSKKENKTFPTPDISDLGYYDLGKSEAKNWLDKVTYDLYIPSYLPDGYAFKSGDYSKGGKGGLGRGFNLLYENSNRTGTFQIMESAAGEIAMIPSEAGCVYPTSMPQDLPCQISETLGDRTIYYQLDYFKNPPEVQGSFFVTINTTVVSISFRGDFGVNKEKSLSEHKKIAESLEKISKEEFIRRKYIPGL